MLNAVQIDMQGNDRFSTVAKRDQIAVRQQTLV